MRTKLACLGSCLLLSVTACGGGDDNSPPKLDNIPDQSASVGTQLSVALRATDPDGDPITFGFKSDISDMGNRAWIDSGAGGTAVFKWIPIGSDVGIHSFDFSASDGKDKARRTVSIDVKSAAAGEGSPIFIKPLGTGTTLDVTTKKCVDVPIVVADADSTEVDFSQEPPLIDGATLEQTDGLVGNWSWCPTAEQISGGELFTLSLSAYDSDHPKVVKDFLIVLQKLSLIHISEPTRPY